MNTSDNGHSNRRMPEYNRGDSAVFLKTKEKYGGLSNMAGGFPLQVNGIPIYTSEALYQACRFPHLPAVQRLIIEQRSPMSAKMKSKPHRENSRPDWDDVRRDIMYWCLRVKLAQNWETFSELLLSTGDRSIVEQSRRDDFWGAKPVDEQTLIGSNVLGRLLKKLRGELIGAVKREQLAALRVVEPLSLPNFLLYERPIDEINALPGCTTQIAHLVKTVRGLDSDTFRYGQMTLLTDTTAAVPITEELPVAARADAEHGNPGRLTGLSD